MTLLQESCMFARRIDFLH